MKRTILIATLITFGYALAVPLAQAGGDKLLLREIEALKKGQESMQKELQEIKKLLLTRQMPSAPPPTQAIDAVLEVGDSPVKGSKDAKLTLIEFSDYQCPFCKRHAMNTLPEIDKTYIATGKVRYVFRDLPLEAIHSQSVKAAEAAHCAGDQGKYWEMHDRLFANQQALGPERLLEQAQSIGLEAEPFKQCLDSGKYAEKVKRDAAEGQKLGITGTPTLLLGTSDGDKVKNLKVIRGSQPFTVFKQEIDQLLKGKSGEQKK